jgi:hypothetical protein
MKKMKMKLPLMGLIILFFISSCSNDPSVELPINGKPLLLTEFKSDDEITRFEYNTDSSVSKIFFTEDPISSDQNVTYTVKFLANKKVDELVGSNGTRIKLSYGPNGIVKSEVFSGNNYITTSEYNYTNTQISSVVVSLFFTNPNRGVPTYKFDFINNNSNNVSKMKLFFYNQVNNQYVEESVVNFQLDDKKNPFAAAGDLMLIFWQYANKNNIVRQENKDLSGDLLELIETNYTYNSFGYPTKATIKITEPGMQPATSQLVFTYK